MVYPHLHGNDYRALKPDEPMIYRGENRVYPNIC